MTKRRIARAAALAFALFSLPALAAQMRIVAIRPDLGVLYVPNLDPNTATLPELINYCLGCGIVMPFQPGSIWSFEPSADLSTTYYELENGRAVPTETAERSAFVIGLLLDAPLALSFRFGEKFTLSVGAGLAFDIRVGILAAPEGAQDIGAINAYFWKAGRFFKPSTFLRGEYRLTERVDFGFAARAYWPLFNLWADEGLGLLDQGIFGGSLGVRYRLE